MHRTILTVAMLEHFSSAGPVSYECVICKVGRGDSFQSLNKVLIDVLCDDNSLFTGHKYLVSSFTKTPCKYTLIFISIVKLTCPLLWKAATKSP